MPYYTDGTALRLALRMMLRPPCRCPGVRKMRNNASAPFTPLPCPQEGCHLTVYTSEPTQHTMVSFLFSRRITSECVPSPTGTRSAHRNKHAPGVSDMRSPSTHSHTSIQVGYFRSAKTGRERARIVTPAPRLADLQAKRYRSLAATFAWGEQQRE